MSDISYVERFNELVKAKQLSVLVDIMTCQPNDGHIFFFDKTNVMISDLKIKIKHVTQKNGKPYTEEMFAKFLVDYIEKNL